MAEDKSTEEIKSIGEEQKRSTKKEGELNDLLKERLSMLKSVTKAQETLNAKLSASTELARDLKELDSLIYKEKQKEAMIRQQLEKYSKEEVANVKQLQANLREKYAAEAAADKKAKEAAEKLHNYNIEALTEEMNLKASQMEAELRQQKVSEEEIQSRVQGFRSEQLKTILENRKALHDEYDTRVKNADTAREEVIQAQKAIGPRQAALLLLQEADDAQKKLLKTLDREKKRREEINDRIGIAGHLAKGSHSLLDKMGIGSFLNMEALNKKMEKAAADGAGKWKIMGIIGSHAMKAIGEALNDPLVIITGVYKMISMMVKGAMGFEKHIADTAKSLGVSVASAKQLHHQFVEIANANVGIGLSIKEVQETYKGINDQLGFMGPQNEEFLATATGLQRRLGLTATDMTNIALYSDKTKKSTADTFNTIIGTAKAQMGKLKFAMSEKQVMDGIGKVSATVLANFKGNVAQMAAAVVKATKLGTSLDEINNAGKSMLDFESSISKEFEAQLLTGKNINLSKAREYALTGQTDKLMDEITKNLGSQAEWNKMNVLQQQSLAEAMGMSKEQVDEMFKKQKLASVLGKDAGADAATQYQKLKDQKMTHEQIAEIMGKDAAQQALQATTQEKMAAAQERLTMAFEKMMSALQPIIDKVVNWLTSTKDLEHTLHTVFKVLTGMGVLFVAYKGYMLYTTTQARIQSNLDKLKTLEKRRQQLLATQELRTKQLSEVKDKTSAAFLKAQINLKKADMALERNATRITAVRAAASVTAGSGWMGPLASIAGGLVLTWLMGLIASGGESAGSPPSMSGGEPKIEPMNEKAEGAKTQNQSITRAKEERQVANFIRVDAVTGIAVAKQSDQEVKADYSKVQ